MENEKFVAFFDILGYKELVQNLSVNELKERMEKVSELVKKYIYYAELSFECDGEINYVIFSDSIVFYSKDMTANSFKSICMIANSFLFFSILDYMPVRGAISHGEFYIDKEKNIFFGKALVKAYETEGMQKWSGACICEETIEYVKSIYSDTVSWLEKANFIFRYEIPISFESLDEIYDKNNGQIESYNCSGMVKKEFYALNWCVINNFIPSEITTKKITIEEFYQYFLLSEINNVIKAKKSLTTKESLTYKELFDKLHPNVKFKILNTKNFFEYSKKYHCIDIKKIEELNNN